MTKKRALLSAYDKTGIPKLARELIELGYDLVSSGGTAKVISGAGLDVTDVEKITGFPAIEGHRVVTLHPKLHGGILADLTDPTHVADMQKYGIEAIDLVIVNLYPFSTDPSIELIDIGGPALIRGAAKNHARVGVVTDPADYDLLIEELQEKGQLSDDFRKRLAAKAFAHTAAPQPHQGAADTALRREPAPKGGAVRHEWHGSLVEPHRPVQRYTVVIPQHV